MAIILKKVFLSAILILMALWVVRYGTQWRTVDNQNYRYTPSEIRNLSSFDEAWVAYGVKAWYENQLGLAGDYLQKGLTVNVLNMDAWLKLAQLSAEEKHFRQAVAILKFTDHLTRQVVKWKWQQLILARELEEEDIFLKNINFIVAYYQFWTDALNLLDLHLAGDVTAALKILDAQNLPDYLKWLMKWQRTNDSLTVWAALSEGQKKTNGLYERYANFLVSQKQIQPAVKIWKHATGSSGMSNLGFEEPLSVNNVFAWKARSGEFWDIQRDKFEAKEGHVALRVNFSGKENIHFAHVSQIVPIEPGLGYRLTFWWRSRDLTTDQRPFMEVRGFQCESNSWTSEMIPVNCDWQEQTLFFTVPETCHAISVTLRRKPSGRFDSNIKGQLWLDDFHLESLNNQIR